MKWLLGWLHALQQSRLRRAEREVLARLDARTLKDVGLESWNGLLAERLEARRQQRVLRVAVRTGAY